MEWNARIQGLTPEFPLDPQRFPESRRPPASACLSIEELLKGYTIEGAIPFRLEDEIGSIEEGKAAHFVILENDLFTMPKTEIHNTRVRAVFFEGRQISGEILS